MMKMTKGKIILIISLLMILITAGLLAGGPFSHYKAVVIESGTGWGYEIKTGKKLYIHQPFIPAIEGNTPFPDKRSARKTGRLVIQKLKDHKTPYISPEEVEEILNNQ